MIAAVQVQQSAIRSGSQLTLINCTVRDGNVGGTCKNSVANPQFACGGCMSVTTTAVQTIINTTFTNCRAAGGAAAGAITLDVFPAIVSSSAAVPYLVTSGFSCVANSGQYGGCIGNSRNSPAMMWQTTNYNLLRLNVAASRGGGLHVSDLGACTGCTRIVFNGTTVFERNDATPSQLGYAIHMNALASGELRVFGELRVRDHIAACNPCAATASVVGMQAASLTVEAGGRYDNIHARV